MNLHTQQNLIFFAPKPALPRLQAVECEPLLPALRAVVLERLGKRNFQISPLILLVETKSAIPFHLVDCRPTFIS